MKKELLAGLAVGVMMFGMTGGASAAQLLVNSGFEAGDFTGWTIGGNSPNYGVNLDGVDLSPFTTPDNFDASSQNVHSGSYAAFAIVSTVPLRQIWLDQTISTAENSTYDIGFWLGVDARSQFGVWDPNTTLILVNGTSISLTGFTNLQPGSSPVDFTNFYGQYTTGANELSVSVSYRISGSSSWQPAFSFDDFYFDGSAPGQPVPEPATMLLFGTGIAGLVAARRRKKAC